MFFLRLSLFLDVVSFPFLTDGLADKLVALAYHALQELVHFVIGTEEYKVCECFRSDGLSSASLSASSPIRVNVQFLGVALACELHLHLQLVFRVDFGCDGIGRGAQA